MIRITAAPGRPFSGRHTLAPVALGEVFGIDLEDDGVEMPLTPPVASTARKVPKKSPRKKRAPTGSVRKMVVTTTKPPKKSGSTKKGGRKRKKLLRELENIAAPRKKTHGERSARKKTPEAGVRSPPFKPTVAAMRRLRRNLGRAPFGARFGVSPQTVANWKGSSGRLNPQPRGLAALHVLHRRTRGS